MQDRRLEISHVGGLFDGACNETELCPLTSKILEKLQKNILGGQADWKIVFYEPPRKGFKS